MKVGLIFKKNVNIYETNFLFVKYQASQSNFQKETKNWIKSSQKINGIGTIV